MARHKLTLEMMEGWVDDGIVECQKCGNPIETDCPECFCGWKNPLVVLGVI